MQHTHETHTHTHTHAAPPVWRLLAVLSLSLGRHLRDKEEGNDLHADRDTEVGWGGGMNERITFSVADQGPIHGPHHALMAAASIAALAPADGITFTLLACLSASPIASFSTDSSA